VSLASIGWWIFVASTWLLAAGWVWQAAQWLLHFHQVPNLSQISASALANLPTNHGPQVTVIVPACNEQESIERTLRSLLASQGIRLQIVAVDDRSTDKTGAIMDSLAAEFATVATAHSLEILHIRELPAGWLGKPHALATAAALARSQWLLFTDGDVFFSPQAVALALGYALAEQADHLVLMPEWTMGSFGERMLHGAIHALTAWTLHLWRIRDPKAKDSLGVGAFNLVRRSSYQAIGGFEALRMEVVEDLRLGWRLKRAQFRPRVAYGLGLVSVRWSQSAWGVVQNLEKNFFAVFRYSIPVLLGASWGIAVEAVLPLAAIVAGGPARAAGIVIYAAIAALYIGASRVTRVSPAYVLFFPLACLIVLFAMLRSMVLTLARGGVMWRGTLYSLKELRAHAGGGWR